MCLEDEVKQLRNKIKRDRIKHDEIIQLAEDIDIRYFDRKKK